MEIVFFKGLKYQAWNIMMLLLHTLPMYKHSSWPDLPLKQLTHVNLHILILLVLIRLKWSNYKESLLSDSSWLLSHN